jgi:hypothetical protein
MMFMLVVYPTTCRLADYVTYICLLVDDVTCNCLLVDYVTY